MRVIVILVSAVSNRERWTRIIRVGSIGTGAAISAVRQ
jgi:hypothetical protein